MFVVVLGAFMVMIFLGYVAAATYVGLHGKENNSSILVNNNTYK